MSDAGKEYEDALVHSGIEHGSKVGVAYRSVPLVPRETEGGGVTFERVRTLVEVVGFHNGYLVYKKKNGTVCIEPLEELLLEIPSEEALGGNRIEVPRGPLVMP